METIFITTGLACLVIAIIGGGLEAFNIKVPSIISSVRRQFLLGIFGAGILLFGIIRESKKSDTIKEKEPEKELTFFMDNDGDGFGNKLLRKVSGTQPEKHVSDSTDDDDNDADLHDLRSAVIYYADRDNDGFGDKNISKKANRKPASYSTNNSDCDDRDAYTKPDQQGMFESKSRGGKFDYNCDGIVKKENDSIFFKANATDHRGNPPRHFIKYREGWENVVPNCGKGGIYIIIQNGRPKKISRTQRCN